MAFVAMWHTDHGFDGHTDLRALGPSDPFPVILRWPYDTVFVHDGILQGSVVCPQI